jgi:hypothetical protein
VLLETGWSWADWLATPPYMQRVVVDVIGAKRRKDADDAEDQKRQADAERRRGGY